MDEDYQKVDPFNYVDYKEPRNELIPPITLIQSLNQIPNLVFGRKFAMDSKNNISVGSGVLKTTATDGFFYIPTCAGTPTGTPTSKTGLVPMVYDTTNHKFWIYDSGWKGVVLS